MTVGDLVTTYAMGINLCTECFGGKGVDCIKAWAETATAPEAWGTLLVRFEIVGLAERCEHVRKGLVQEHAFGAKEAPVVARKITKMRTLLAGLSVQAREAHQVAIDRFEESADALMALVSPAQSEYALESLRAKLHSGRYAWVVLDETPTVLAIEGNANWRVHQVKLAPELIAAMTISETANKGIVLYGPRFAMEYLMRAWGESNAYMVATTEDDAEVAKLAGGIWGIGSGIDDLFCALETARSLVHA
jgi:hypothetical protein